MPYPSPTTYPSSTLLPGPAPAAASPAAAPPPGPEYTFLLTTMSGTPYSETPGATAKSIIVPVVGMATSSLVVRGDSSDADFLLGGDALMRVYERREDGVGPVLLGHHRLVTAEEVAVAGGDHTVAATFADPVWTLMRRLVGKSTTGYSRGSPFAQVDRGAIIGELLGATNAEGPTGVRLGVLAASSNTYVQGWFFKKLGEAIAELGATLDGPDWRVRPIEYAGGVYGELDVRPSIGMHRPDAAFEYGDGRLNVRGYRRGVTNEHTANRIYSLPAGFPDNAVGAILTDQDTASQAARNLLEDVITSDVTVDDLRRGILAAHIAARRGARQTISFDLTRDLIGRVPRYGIDFSVGDTVPFRASVTRELELVKRIDITARVYSYGVNVDDAGYGTPTVNVTPA